MPLKIGISCAIISVSRWIPALERSPLWVKAYSEKNAEKAYAKGKADESLQCLFFEGYLSAGALRKENRRRLFAENAGNNGVKMP